MDRILNYIFIGFAFTFTIDYIADKYSDHSAFKDVPDWGWGSRIKLILFWPLGIAVFIYTFLKERFR